MKHISKLSVRIVIAVIIGFLFASIGVGIAHNTSQCTTADVPKGESISQCVSIKKTFIHPDDLFHNKRDSLIHFSETFVVASLTTFAILSVFRLVQKKKA